MFVYNLLLLVPLLTNQFQINMIFFQQKFKLRKNDNIY